MVYSNSTSASQQGGATYSTAAAVINGGLPDTNSAAFLWCATCRDNTISNAGASGGRFQQATRTSSSPFYIGLKENIEIQCNTGMPWQWRRICFTMKGQPLVLNSQTSPVFNIAAETQNGWVRVMNQVPGNPGQNPAYGMYQVLFRGVINGDWVDPMTAQVDTTRITLKYDKTVTLASGNEDGFIRNYKRWHPMMKTLVYDDDEVGGAMSSSSYSTEGKPGMGDYYILDQFRARQGSATTDQLTVRPSSTLYWHEK